MSFTLPGPFSGSLESMLVFVVLSAFSGFVAALVMGVPMSRQEDGFTPAYIAASILRGTTPDEVSEGDAYVTHYGAGVLAGILYAVAYTALAALLPPLVSVGSMLVLPHAVATAVVVGFVYSFFAHLVLPRAGKRVYEERSTAVRGQWLRSSFVFGLTLVVVLPLLTAGL
ncbi:hypothetical protein GL213_04830 [Halogeometricum borinquense]|uniref:Uncharacterized protein n=1 Tax=Halogeometricum borinquense TaxID=60847 RepID=A0A6C0UHX6_9EURY|nr:hypothetical protein [Halogeometricum borinquense]QIB75116.1 hypothetical protein G3I44_12995 [Halogeometricum borinquense]QIQ75902.1 hypothetical protein GL213_04830 [Halogeometricum borinquense]